MTFQTVLISDPDPQELSSLARQARALGFTVLTDICSDVCDLAARYQPAAIVLEVSQRVDGRDLLAELKRDPKTRNLAVVVFSSVKDEFVKRTCLELGALGYILKPGADVIQQVAHAAGLRPALLG